ncbi:MAG: DUF1722 domain-containing protein [Gammaproteobacteria bacterium]|nr:DUF1722 domain-containing protein [Gammaproteobacteria bacterium]
MSKITNKPQIGVSACLASHPVRFDGSFISNAFVKNECSSFFDIHTVCPEVEMGMSIPRQVIQLRDFGDDIQLVYSKNPEHSISDEMRAFSQNKLKQLPQLDGYVFKKDSPSCGVYKVPVKSNKTGMRTRNGIGVFAQEFKKKYPHVPTEDEGRLNDMGLRENFLERVYAHYRWRSIFSAHKPAQAFRDFHKKYKLILMAKNNAAYRQLGRIVSQVNEHNFAQQSEDYIGLFMQAMSKIPSQGHHINVMMHILGYLKNHLDKAEKSELLNWFEIFRAKRVTRITPLMLLQHHFTKHKISYIAEQYYFSPFPNELMLPGSNI